MKRVFIVHGWSGGPDDAWMPWLDQKLTERGFKVVRLSMPHPDEPTIDDWVQTLADAVGAPDADTFFVGHSIGVQTILRYLARLPEGARVGSVACVAGFFTLSELPTDEAAIAAPWLTTSFDVHRVRHVAASIFAVFSDDDPDVPIENRLLFQERLGAKTVLEHGKGHFSDDAGVREVPAVLAFLLEDAQ